MKNKIILVAVLFCLMAAKGNSQIVTKLYGTYCLNAETVFDISSYNCTYSWYISGASPGSDYQVVYGGTNGKTFRVKWLTTKTNIYAYCNYSCNGSSGTAQSSTFSIGTTVTPGVSLSLSQSTVCQGNSITLTASPTNGGPSPTYTWSLVNSSNVTTNLGSTSSNTYSLNTATLSGTYSVRVSMLSNADCIPGGADPVATQSLTVNQKQTFTATLNGPTNVCSTTTTGTLVTTISNGGGNLTYKWYRTDIYNQIGETVNNNMLTNVPISNGDVFFCRVFSDGCYNSPVQTNSHTVSVSQAITPTIGINLPKLNYCTGETMQLTASSP